VVRAVGEAISPGHTLEHLAGTLAQALSAERGVGRVAIWLREPGGGHRCLSGSILPSRGFGSLDAASADEAMLLDAALKKPLHLDAAAAPSPDMAPTPAERRSIYLHPLCARGKTVGVIGMALPADEDRSRTLQAALGLVAPSIALALDAAASESGAVGPAIDASALELGRGPAVGLDFRRTLETAVGGAERALIERALAATQNNRTRAARLLGIGRRTLLYKIKRYGISERAASA